MGAGAAFVLATATPAAADNFEFVVEGQPGLALTISGYDTAGAEMFAERAQPEQREGKVLYVIRVDETVLESAPLDRWCAEDASGEWKELEGRGDAKSLCDVEPTETRGRYIFKPGQTVQAEAPEASPQISVAEASACVQAGLNSLGFDAGPVDGQMGRRTASAAQAFLDAVQAAAYPELTQDSAIEWCTLLNAAIADGTAKGPGESIARFRFGPDVDGRTASETRQALADVNAFFARSSGGALEKPGTIYVSADAKWMTDAYLVHLQLGENFRRGKMENFSGCNGGEAGYGFMFMCSRSEVFAGDWFGAGSAAQKGFALAHEYFHMLQYERAVGSLEGCCSGVNTLAMVGPQWLVEGSAEYVAFRFLADSGRIDLDREIAWHTEKAAEVEVGLDAMQSREGYYAQSRASSSGMIAAHHLVESAGLASLGTFYDEMGQGKDWETAFEVTFGMTPAVFYEAFEARVR